MTTDTVKLMQGNCLELLPQLLADSADCVITDPPYDLKPAKGRSGGFMNKAWDGTGIAFCPETWQAVLRVLKPGGYLLCFGGTRTFHRLACALEDAGFEIRDTLCWLYGTGFPKGKGCLKPAWEPILLARKPGPRVLPLGIEECRIGTDAGWSYPNGRGGSEPHHMQRGERNGLANVPCKASAGRWPANVVLSDDNEVLEAFASFGESKSPNKPVKQGGHHRHDVGLSGNTRNGLGVGYGDTGTAARFFYTAKASRRERGDGNNHPTVKPFALMRWLVKLVCPVGGVALDPFMGSGTTGVACVHEGRRFIGMDNDAEQGCFATATNRIAAAQQERRDSMPLFREEASQTP